jgi:nucleoid DNA-binding protein
MDKPVSMSVKDYLIKVMSVRTNTPSATIEAIVKHQFESAREAMRSNDSIEISGFCKFFFNKKKAIKKLDIELRNKKMYEALLSQDITEAKRISTTKRLASINETIEFLTKKLC